jgi:hypothetical protein
VGSLTIINSNLKNVSSEEDKIIAIALAGDGLERVRNVRDSNWIANEADWKVGIEGENPSNTTIRFFCGDTAVYDKVPSDPETLNACSANRCRIYIYENDVTGEICYSDNWDTQTGFTSAAPIATNFYRLIRLTERNGGNAVEVNSEVKWSSGGHTYTTSASEILYNWK